MDASGIVAVRMMLRASTMTSPAMIGDRVCIECSTVQAAERRAQSRPPGAAFVEVIAYDTRVWRWPVDQLERCLETPHLYESILEHPSYTIAQLIESAPSGTFSVMAVVKQVHPAEMLQTRRGQLCKRSARLADKSLIRPGAELALWGSMTDVADKWRDAETVILLVNPTQHMFRGRLQMGIGANSLLIVNPACSDAQPCLYTSLAKVYTGKHLKMLHREAHQVDAPSCRQCGVPVEASQFSYRLGRAIAFIDENSELSGFRISTQVAEQLLGIRPFDFLHLSMDQRSTVKAGLMFERVCVQFEVDPSGSHPDELRLLECKRATLTEILGAHASTQAALFDM
ncbi:hypothetical protein THASP1DRAFT_25681 [Thamnocephalis sphaerospora]|uniref:Uncharacterized protein n=1 Tax=Thamnocephalis sphaerospora TaxID=78915 RepID=A0A4P9XJK9_9FUNG|nr:hypothetical protein THASP1DRAFT_25681 [Thamnocephalis sphaerospora]|eukprot:RKP05906.1 hypothetical protein THASP1DRAFT_25681 [Thamnocephalis sphaerospora]